MPGRRTILIATVPVLVTLLFTSHVLSPAQATARQNVSLMSTLAEWKYPDTKMPQGASMSDGGIPNVQSIKCQAVLTTPDAFEKVIKFYSEKLGTDAVGDPRVRGGGLKLADAKSLSSQDDSQGRPVSIRVFVVNRLDTSTTLVISRADSEKETHITWSHFMRLADTR